MRKQRGKRNKEIDKERMRVKGQSQNQALKAMNIKMKNKEKN